ncbi:MAG: SPASM domain-containing protein [Acidimicrobiales bacterium]|nr:SPASM domain-containing protein [Acidimicrobiales bacterium]
MEPDRQAAYDAHRNLADKAFRAACYAPVTSLYLDPAGDVRACCQNVEHVLGNVAHERLPDIWRGEPAQRLRAAMVDYDLSQGCRFCQWQIEDGNPGGALAHDFDGLAVPTADPAWPQRLELAVSNTCNLECIMCDGDLSSAIRARRERRPPLPVVYDDRFFADLAEFLPHLVEVRFLGGEPFLARESFRVWDLMIDAGLRTPCRVTTNGTQWNERVERVLDHFPVSVALSLDGVTRETVEAIRVNASYDRLMDHLARFHRYTRERGTDLGLTFCLMRRNWHEFGDYLLLADRWDARVGVNTVIREPFSLYSLPLDDLERVVRALEERDDELRSRLTLNAGVWADELARLRHWVERSAVTAVEVRRTYFQGGTEPGGDGDPAPPAAPAPAPDPPPPDPRVSTRVEPLPPVLVAGADPTTPEDAERATATAEARVLDGLRDGRVSLLECDDEDRVVRVGPDGAFVGVSAERCVGTGYADLVEVVAAILGAPSLVSEALVAGGVLRRLRFDPAEGAPTFVQAFAFPRPGGRGGSVTVAAVTRHPPDWAAVSPS